MLLLALLAVDVGFIAVHVYLQATDRPIGVWNSFLDYSLPEFWQYFKWLLLIAMTAQICRYSRQGLYLTLLALFVYLLFDDSLQIHERVGAWIAGLLQIEPHLGLRRQDFGELLTTAIAATILLGAVFLAYRRSDDLSARRFTRQIFVRVVVLAFFGVGLDMLDIMVKPVVLRWTLAIIEELGEMVATTLIVSCAFSHLVFLRSQNAALDGKATGT